jgi:cytidine deaminase
VPEDQQLWEAAVAAQKRAYAPYSQFPVGAAIRCQDGSIVSGCNVENASYPLSCCAERNAVYSAVALGHRQFARIVIVGPGPSLIAPCGACRQVLAEFGDFEVVMADAKGSQPSRLATVSELLPQGFSRENLHGL